MSHNAVYYATKQAPHDKRYIDLVKVRDDCFEPEHFIGDVYAEDAGPEVWRNMDLISTYQAGWREARLRSEEMPVLDQEAQEGIRRGLALAIKRGRKFEESLRVAGASFADVCAAELAWLATSKFVRNSQHPLPTFNCGNCLATAPFVWLRDDNGTGNDLAVRRYCLRCHMMPGGRSSLFSVGGNLDEVRKQLLPKPAAII